MCVWAHGYVRPVSFTERARFVETNTHTHIKRVSNTLPQDLDLKLGKHASELANIILTIDVMLGQISGKYALLRLTI